MKLGLVGLGRMGQSIAARLLHAGIDVVAYDPDASRDLNLSLFDAALDDHPDAFWSHRNPAEGCVNACARVKAFGLFERVDSIKALAAQVSIFWIMVPVKAVDAVISDLRPALKEGDIVIDGGNSFFKDSIRRYEELKKIGVSFIDCGTSGGLHGRMVGFSLMLGGDEKPIEQMDQIFCALAAKQGYGRVGSAGAGHYVKMIHNGIEYALMQAYGEGFDLLKNGSYKNLDLKAISSIWVNGSIIRSWLLELSHEIFTRDQNLGDIYGAIGESGMGAWTVDQAREHKVPVAVIETALTIRAQSRKTGGNFATKLVSLLRQAFGGHPVAYVFYKQDQKGE